MVDKQVQVTIMAYLVMCDWNSKAELLGGETSDSKKLQKLVKLLKKQNQKNYLKTIRVKKYQ